MTMPRLGERETNEQQPLPMVRICWDELFDFLKKLFKPRAARAWTELGSLPAETSTNYKVVFKAKVPADCEGALQDISLYSSRADTTDWKLMIAGQEQFADKKIFVTLTLNYGGMTIHTEQEIILWAKTDGTATDIAAALTGELRYLKGQ
ncbi:hypothetical protein ES705_07845 [subsurface metagenome]